jgi:Ni,Fe-hydrogenase maturation factor
MNPASVIQMVSALGGEIADMLVVGCEPSSVEPDENGQIGLSPVVAAAVKEAICVIQKLLSENQQVTAA